MSNAAGMRGTYARRRSRLSQEAGQSSLFSHKEVVLGVDNLPEDASRLSPASVFQANLSGRSSTPHSSAAAAPHGRIPPASVHPSGMPLPQPPRRHRYSLVLPMTEESLLSSSKSLKTCISQPNGPGGGYLEHLQRITSRASGTHSASQVAHHRAAQMRVAYNSVPTDCHLNKGAVEPRVSDSMFWSESQHRLEFGLSSSQQQHFMLDQPSSGTCSTDVGQFFHSRGQLLPVILDSSLPGSAADTPKSSVNTHTQSLESQDVVCELAPASKPIPTFEPIPPTSQRFSVTDALQRFSERYDALSRGSSESNGTVSGNTYQAAAVTTPSRVVSSNAVPKVVSTQVPSAPDRPPTSHLPAASPAAGTPAVMMMMNAAGQTVLGTSAVIDPEHKQEFPQYIPLVRVLNNYPSAAASTLHRRSLGSTHSSARVSGVLGSPHISASHSVALQPGPPRASIDSSGHLLACTQQPQAEAAAKALSSTRRPPGRRLSRGQLHRAAWRRFVNPRAWSRGGSGRATRGLDSVAVTTLHALLMMFQCLLMIWAVVLLMSAIDSLHRAQSVGQVAL